MLKYVYLVSGFCCLSASFAYADEAVAPFKDNLLGNWAGLRAKMTEQGIAPNLEYKADF